MSDQMISYQDLEVWKKSMDLSVAVYRMTEYFPNEERFGLTNQMRRASVSIPSNIAEGSRRKSKPDNLRFLVMAYGSGAELETQIILAKRLSYLKADESQAADLLLNEVMRMLNVMTRSTNYDLQTTS